MDILDIQYNSATPYPQVLRLGRRCGIIGMYDPLRAVSWIVTRGGQVGTTVPFQHRSSPPAPPQPKRRMNTEGPHTDPGVRSFCIPQEYIAGLLLFRAQPENPLQRQSLRTYLPSLGREEDTALAPLISGTAAGSEPGKWAIKAKRVGGLLLALPASGTYTGGACLWSSFRTSTEPSAAFGGYQVRPLCCRKRV